MTGVLVVLAALQLVSYQNCGSDFVVKDGLVLASALGSACEASLEAEFKSSYQSFLKTNCATCHTSAGPGNGAFHLMPSVALQVSGRPVSGDEPL